MAEHSLAESTIRASAEVGSVAAGIELRAVLGVVDLMPFGIIVIDEAGSVRHSNRTANDLLRRGSVLAVDGRRLCAVRPVDSGTLRHAIAELAARAHKHPGETLLRIWRSRAVSGFVALLVTCVDPHHQGDRLLLTLVTADGEAVPAVDPTVLRTLYDLTAAEARVAALLVAGHTPAEIAGSLGITLNTVRTHIRRLLSKTGSRRQSALMRRLLTGIGHLRLPIR